MLLVLGTFLVIKICTPFQKLKCNSKLSQIFTGILIYRLFLRTQTDFKGYKKDKLEMVLIVDVKEKIEKIQPSSESFVFTKPEHVPIR